VGTRGLTATENGKGSGVGTSGLERWRGARLGGRRWRDGGGACGVGRWRGALARAVGRSAQRGAAARRRDVETATRRENKMSKRRTTRFKTPSSPPRSMASS
jgi:hypothetical protein